MKYDRGTFLNYVLSVIQEMEKRQIKFQNKYVNEFISFCSIREKFSVPTYYPEHNNRYLKQCFYNLEEKYDRGIISEEEWKEILKVAYKENIIE